MSNANPIRILHVTEASNAGVGGHVLDLMEGLPAFGCEVHFAYSPLRVDKFFQERLEQLDASLTTEIPMRRSPHWSDFQALKQLKKCIQEKGPFDIIHAHSTKAGGLCRMSGITKLGKVTYTPNGIFSMNPCSNPMARRLVRIAEKRLARKGDSIIAVSPEEHQHMLDIGLPESKIKMIPNGLRSIDWPSRELIRKQLGYQDDEVVIGFLGRLASQKNPLLLLRAFAKIEPGDQKIRLAMVGTGPLETECKELANQLGISDRIDWLGFKTAIEAMPAFDIFVMPSRYEGMPYVMMEAISLGIPMVATRVGGTSLGIDQGVNGFVVPLDAEDEMAEALQTLLFPKIRHEMSLQALKKAKEFLIEKMVERTVNHYQSLLGQRLPATSTHQPTAPRDEYVKA